MTKVQCIENGKVSLGIEFGSTRIKAVLIDTEGQALGSGIYEWENSLIDGIWTYDIKEVKLGLRSCYKNLKDNVLKEYGVSLKKFLSIGISGMMHGYLALDKNGNLLAPFQTWRNSNTEKAADELTELFKFNIPLRWSVAHLYQRILDKEEHVKDITYMTTLAGYVHFLLTGEKVLGVGDASGMFPIDSDKKDYNAEYAEKFDNILKASSYAFRLKNILPKVMLAGDFAGKLSKEGSLLLDESGEIEENIPFCPPEGDAGTGMVATGAVSPKTGNFSAGTSMFAMLVLEKELKKYYREIDIVTTPEGHPVAMSHANNGTSDLNAWIGIFKEFSALLGVEVSDKDLYKKLYTKSLEGDLSCGGLLSYGYYSGEGIFHLNDGRPLFLRGLKDKFTLANFMKAHLYSSLTAVKVGLDILTEEENAKIDSMYGHGGLFKTKEVGQRYLADSIKAPVIVRENASEGGAFGIAVLALYSTLEKRSSLNDFLADKIFKDEKSTEIIPGKEEIEGFEEFTKRYIKGLELQRKALDIVE